MKRKPLHSSLTTLLFIALCSFGFLQTVEAQMTVFNNTSCNVAVIVAQTTNGTCPPCNQSGFMVLPPGNFYTHPVFDVCGPELWENVRYFVGPDFGVPPITSFGVSFNPLLPVNCGASFPGVCSFNINANWVSGGGGGPQFVILN